MKIFTSPHRYTHIHPLRMTLVDILSFNLYVMAGVNVIIAAQAGTLFYELIGLKFTIGIIIYVIVTAPLVILSVMKNHEKIKTGERR